MIICLMLLLAALGAFKDLVADFVGPVVFHLVFQFSQPFPFVRAALTIVDRKTRQFFEIKRCGGPKRFDVLNIFV